MLQANRKCNHTLKGERTIGLVAKLTGETILKTNLCLAMVVCGCLIVV